MQFHRPAVPSLDFLEPLENTVERVCDLSEGKLLTKADTRPTMEGDVFPPVEHEMWLAVDHG
jgi:hypothetical protein